MLVAKHVLHQNALKHGVRSLSSLPTGYFGKDITIAENKLYKHHEQVSNPSRTLANYTKYSTKDDLKMFCRQCEQTKSGTGCFSFGVCGKTAETSNMQDLLFEVVKNVASYAVLAREYGCTAEEMKNVNLYTLNSVFSTLTNVNFSEERIVEYIKEGVDIKEELKELIKSKQGEVDKAAEDLEISKDASMEELEELSKRVGVLQRKDEMDNDDAFSLHELCTYGVRGVCAYTFHAEQLGSMDEENIMKPLHEIIAQLASSKPDKDAQLANALKLGEINARTLALLDQCHAEKLGVPEVTQVRMTAVEGKAILVSGHDMADMYEILKQTEGKGVNVYTHGEMLPAHQYPELKKFKHLVGNYGTAWQNQKWEFSYFPGPIVMTTNCISEPRKSYKDRIFTINATGVDGVKHIHNKDFSEVIDKALSMDGFKKTIKPVNHHTVGFNHRVVVPLVDKVIDAAKSGALSRIFLIGGCDGSEHDRNYYTDLAESVPSDSLILTMGCAKNRVIHSRKLHNETLSNGLPRVLDMGQCNDAYSAVVLATELAKALDCSVNDLPLSLAISHMEQKTVAVLLTLFHLGIRNIRLGPRLPAYLSDNNLKFLQKKFNLMPSGDADEDLKLMMEGK